MDHIHVLNVLFDTIIGPQDLPAFRGAFAHRVGLENEWFHNHDNSESEHKFHYRYPLIQYKRRGNQPQIVCIGQGVEAARMFFDNLVWDMEMNGVLRPMQVEELVLRKYPIGIGEEMIYTYQLYDWQPLNQKNYREYQSLQGLMEIIQFLEPKLVAHIISFAKGIRWSIEQKIQLEITEMYPIRTREFKGFEPVLFNFAFQTNVLLPDGIGLGKGASTGFGNIRRRKQREERHRNF
ncbi:MAG: CRISPR-associated endonuclease Cas6 [Bacteroidia bacterium]